MGNNEIGLQVSRQTPTLFLSLTLAMIAANSENLEPMRFLAPCCVKKLDLCEWATIGLYHVLQNYCYSSSGPVRQVDTFRNPGKRTFGGRCTNIARTFGMNKKHEPKPKSKEEAYLNLYNSKSSASHLCKSSKKHS